MCASPTDALGAGGACFYVPASAQTVAVQIDDASGLPVTGGIAFRDIRGRPVGKGVVFCDRTEVAVPRGADRAIVTADAYAIECGIPATGGRIAATFR